MNAPVRDLAPKFDIVAFPCNQFGLQEPGDGLEILHGLRYVRPGQGFVPEFAVATKTDVNGPKEHPLFTYLKSACDPPTKKIGDRNRLYWDPIMVGDVTWNFEKFLVDVRGKVRYRFTPSTPVRTVLDLAMELIAEGELSPSLHDRSDLMDNIKRRLIRLLGEEDDN